MKKIIIKLCVLCFAITSKANIKDILLNDKSYFILDSLCSKYYHNNDSINITPDWYAKNQESVNLSNKSFEEVVQFLVSCNRNKYINISSDEWKNSDFLAGKLLISFDPELFKVSRQYALKDFELVKENIRNFFAILISKENKVEKYDNNQLVNLSAGDVERMLYTKTDAVIVKEELDFLLHNSNYKLIK